MLSGLVGRREAAVDECSDGVIVVGGELGFGSDEVKLARKQGAGKRTLLHLRPRPSVKAERYKMHI